MDLFEWIETTQDLEDLAGVYSEHDDLVQHHGEVLRQIRKRMANLMLESEVLAGGKTWKRSKVQASYEYPDDKQLVSAVIARGRDERMVDEETGEALESEADAVARTINRCWKLGARTVRSTALAEIGLRVDDFRSQIQPGHYEARPTK